MLGGFDEAVLEDELLVSLKSSPITQGLVGMRAKEIVMEIVSGVAVSHLKRDLEALQDRLDEQKSLKHKQERSIKKDYARSLTEKQERLSGMIEQMRLLEQENEQLKNQIEELRDSNQQFEEIVNQLTLRNGDDKGSLEALEEELRICQESKALIEQSGNNIRAKYEEQLTEAREKLYRVERELRESGQMRVQLEVAAIGRAKEELEQSKRASDQQKQLLEKKQQQIMRLREERVEQTQASAKLKTEGDILKTELAALKDKYSHFSEHYNRLKQTYLAEKETHESERKTLNERLLEYNNKYKVLLRVKASAKKAVVAVRVLKGEKDQMKNQMRKEVESLHRQLQRMFSLALDQIGGKMQRQLLAVAHGLERKNQEILINRQENAAKQQLIAKMERLLENTSVGAVQLRSELRAKKREETKLRKEIKRNFEQKDIQLTQLERKYRDILRDTSLI